MKSIILFLCFTTTALFAQTFDKAKADEFFRSLETNNKFMGSVALSQDGKSVYTKSVGFADIANKTPSDEHAKFRIGSISKMFTTVLIFKAIEDKKLKISDKIDTYFPSVENAAKITIGQLLSHRSGIHNFTNDAEYMAYMTIPKSENEMVAIIAKAKSDFEPDSKAEYSNSNFVLLTFILEKTFNKKYGELVKEKITKPLKLNDTYVGGKINILNHEVNSYAFSKTWEIQPETDMSIPLGAGAIVSTPTDLSRFIEALFSGKLISASSLDQMKTIKDGYGMGMFSFPIEGKTGYGHNGGIDGFSSLLMYFPESKQTVALTSNGSSYGNNKIATDMLSLLNNKSIPIPEFKNYDYTADELNQYIGVYGSAQIPLKITVEKDGTTLTAQATGQAAFPLESSKKDVFSFSQAGIIMEFIPAEKKMLLKQNGGVFNFVKE